MSLKPNPGILDITPYVGGRGARAWRGRADQAVVERKRVGPEQGGDRGVPRGGRRARILSRRRRDRTARCDRADLRARSVAHRLRQWLGRAAHHAGERVSEARRRGAVQRARASSSIASSRCPTARCRSRCRRKISAPMSMRCWRRSRRRRASSISPIPTIRPASYLPHDEVRRLHAGLRADILLVLDAAYAEYVRRNDYEAGIEMVANFPNVVMTRTFSKIYGLAGLRVGWAYCPAAVADVLNRMRGPFNVYTPGTTRRRGRAEGPRPCRSRCRAQRQMARLADRRTSARSACGSTTASAISC